MGPKASGNDGSAGDDSTVVVWPPTEAPAQAARPADGSQAGADRDDNEGDERLEEAGYGYGV
jgi:hypothetical protein